MRLMTWCICSVSWCKISVFRPNAQTSELLAQFTAAWTPRRIQTWADLTIRVFRESAEV